MKMKYTTIVCCLFSLAIAATNKDKRIKLEDIERDNLSNERKLRQNFPAGIKMQYGFVPMKDPPINKQQPPSQQQYEVQYQVQPQVQYYHPDEYEKQYAELFRDHTLDHHQYQPQFRFPLLQALFKQQQQAQQTHQHQQAEQPTEIHQQPQQTILHQQQPTLHQQASVQQQPIVHHQPTAHHQQSIAHQQPIAHYQPIAHQQQIGHQQLIGHQQSYGLQQSLGHFGHHQSLAHQQPFVQHQVQQLNLQHEGHQPRFEQLQQHQEQPQHHLPQPQAAHHQLLHQQLPQPQVEGHHQLAQPQHQLAQYQSPQFVSKGDNLQHIIDNHLQNYLKQSPQYVQAPQYVYVQPNQEASNNVQSVVDAKGNVQYFTYLPLSHITSGDFVQSDLTASQTYNVLPQVLPSSKAVALAQNSVQQYEQQPPITVQLKQAPGIQYKETPTYQYNEDKARQFATPVIGKASPAKYATIQESDYAESPGKEVQVQKQVMVEIAGAPKQRKPQSLLESYIPSILQFQYYKAQQSRIQQQFKNALAAGKSGVVKQAYVPAAQKEVASSEVAYRPH